LKSLSILILFLLTTINYSYSQTTFGPKAGMNVANINSKVSDADFPAELNYRLGYYIGAFAQKHIKQVLILRAELFYSTKGASYSAFNYNYQIKASEDLHYINLPILFGCRPIRNLSSSSENLFLFIGAELGYFFEARTINKIAQNGTSTAGYINSRYKQFDKALAVGVSYLINYFLEIEARYNYGFKNIFSDLDAGANRVFQLGVAYHFSKSPSDTNSSKLPKYQKSPRYYHSN